MKSYQKKYRACFAGALISILISTLFAVMLQFFKGQVLDQAVAGRAQETLRAVVLLAAFILAEVLFFYLYRRLAFRFSVGCVKSLKQDIIDSILRREYTAFKSQPQGIYTAKYTQEADAIRARRFAMLPLLWEILLKIVLVSIALFWLDWRVALITLALLTTPLYVPKLIEGRLQRAQEEQLRTAEEALVKLSDWLSGFEVIKNYSVEARIARQFKSVNDWAMLALLQDMRLSALSQLLTTLISYLSYFVVLAFAAWLVLTGAFTAGDFFVAIGMIDQLSYPLISLAEVLRQLIAIRPACKDMEQFLSEAPEHAKVLNSCESADRIEWQNVTFGYTEQCPLLSDFSLTLQRGGRYLLRGPSGSGKTTAVNLLLKYHQPDAGRILIDGKPVAMMDSTYGCVTVVRQDATLFHETLRDNLTLYGELPDERLIQVLEDVELQHLANTQGLDNLIAEGGTNLSGGEKKRIALARALLHQRDVLILDEPLANLDPDTASRIEDLLLSITDRTVLIVSHQFTPEKLSRFSLVVDLAPTAC